MRACGLGVGGYGMAKTAQNAQRSTGGKQARKQLAALATARNRHERRVGRDLEYPAGTGLDYVVYNGCGEYVVKFENDRRTTLTESELKVLLDPLVMTFCMHNRGLKLTAKTAVWWGLLDKEAEGQNASQRDFTVRWVKFDPTLGVDEEPIKGGFLGKDGERSQPFSIRMYSLGGFEDGPRVGKQVQKLFETCTKRRPGQWVEVGPLGSRRAASAEEMAPYIVDGGLALPYESTEASGCVPMAAANAVHPYDPEAAEKISKCDPEVTNLAEFANYLQDEVRTWAAENPFKRLARETSRYIGARERLQWVLQQEHGIFIVQPLIRHGGNSHIIGVDCAKKKIYDPLERNTLRLQEEVLGLCAGGCINQCRGIGEVRQLKPQERSQAPRKRQRRGNKGRSTSNFREGSSSNAC